jgi:hypothetical protein
MIEDIVFTRVEGASGHTWYCPTNIPNKASQLHVDTHDPNSRGYGGSTLEFRLDDGTVAEVKGPWHSNSGYFLDDTGVDITATHLTRVICGGSFSEKWSHTEEGLNDIFYNEVEPVLGTFHRYEAVCDALLRDRGGVKFAFIMISEGGSSAGIYEAKED